jgi:hypothetical protein
LIPPSHHLDAHPQSSTSPRGSVIAAQPAAFATAVAPVDANSTSKKASTPAA